MAGNYSLPLTSEVDADSPLNESLFNTRIRGTLLGLGYANSVFGTFMGSGADTTTGPTETGNLDCGAAGKQYTSWTIPAGVTITLTAAGGVHRIGVTGTLTIEGTLSADGAGGAGGASSTSNNNALALASGGNGSSSGGSGGNGDTGAYSDNFGRGGFAYSGGFASGLLDTRNDDSDYHLLGWRAGTAGRDGIAALTGVLGSWYANPCLLGPGGGGGGGGTYGTDNANLAGGAGGKGGGLIIIECDTFVFSAGAIISANGVQGAHGQTSTYGHSGHGGSGGGGTVVVICRVLTSNAGTITVTGAAAHSGTWPTGGAGGAGRYAIVVLGAQASAGTA